ncbi:MAG: UDP-N-acetylmuramate dehydrogenase [Halioglobus sp.]
MKLLSSEPLQAFNTLSLCAIGELLVSVRTERELTDALAWAQHQKKKVTAFGAGSNVVLAGDISGLVIVQNSTGIEIVSEDDSGVVLRVAAGENWHNFVVWCLEEGFYGLENLALIPGTVGAAPIQNIGAYGVEIKSFINAVHARRILGQEQLVLSKKQCEFSYRDSVFKHSLRDQFVITSVELRLRKNEYLECDYPELAKELERENDSATTAQNVFDAVVKIRSSKLPDPAIEPNAGSFFKNPVLPVAQAQELMDTYHNLPAYRQENGKVKFPAAWFIDQCGWKGYRQNGVGVHPEHALVLVNYGSNSGVELLKLAGKISGSIKERFGIVLVKEPRTYGGAYE